MPCTCGCTHEPDYGACEVFLEGRNGRCVNCDHAAACHPGKGPMCNGPLEPRQFDMLLVAGMDDEDAVDALELLRSVGVVIAFGAHHGRAGEPACYSAIWAQRGKIQPPKRFYGRLKRFLSQEQVRKADNNE